MLHSVQSPMAPVISQVKETTVPAPVRKQAPLSSRLFMILRELPSYLSTAYSLKYKDIKPESGIFAPMLGKIKRYFQLFREILSMGGTPEIFQRNIQRLDADFDALNKELPGSKRPICAYFVSSEDTNGAILGNHLYYYHHYKIGNFKKHFDVSAKVVRSTSEMFNHLNRLKATYPDRPIKVVDIVAHGDPWTIFIKDQTGKKSNLGYYQKQNVEENGFQACAPDAAIILDACSTGKGNSIAQRIAENNRGKKVFAPSTDLFFSKPTITVREGKPVVDHITHGFSVVRAFTAREFQYPVVG